jgi:phage protein D
MVRGIITTLTPRFPESGVPTLGVGGQDSMVRLKDRKPKDGEQKKFVDMADWEIARAVAARNGLKFHATEQGERRPLVVQKNQDDALFLMERAKRIDYDCYVQTDPQSGAETLNFVRPTDGRDGRPVRVYEFEWGKSLITFSPKLTSNDQVGKVTVRGWDPATKKPITASAGPGDLPGAASGGTSGPHTAQKTLDDKQDLLVDQPVASQQEARDLAMSLLRERASRFNTGSGRVIGLPDLRPGDNVLLSGLGKRFNGTYEVTKVEHSLGGSGYQTSFDVKRFFDGGTR